MILNDNIHPFDLYIGEMLTDALTVEFGLPLVLF